MENLLTTPMWSPTEVGGELMLFILQNLMLQLRFLRYKKTFNISLIPL